MAIAKAATRDFGGLEISKNRRIPVSRLMPCMVFLWFLPLFAHADGIQIAVASNFKPAMAQLVTAFEKNTDHEISVSYASTGKHYAQIVNGAPYDAFLAADSERPRRLEEAHLAVPGSRFTYAVGRLVLWAPGEHVEHDGSKFLQTGSFRFFAIANPQTAPYGKAAREVLINVGVWENMQSQLVRGENIAQVFAFVQTGNADAGLIALSQAIQNSDSMTGSRWRIPADQHDAISQQAVLLKEKPAAREFLDFLRGREAKKMISRHGYVFP